MDQHTFDRFTRAVATGQSRRAFVRRLLGAGVAVFATSRTAERSLAAPVAETAEPQSTVRLQEPGELGVSTQAPEQTIAVQDGICIAPLIESDCGCLDPNSEVCCQDAVCSGVCTAADGCCNVSTDTTVVERGELCGDHCCHPHLDPADPGYSECCDNSCCAGHCYGEDLCCPVDLFCPGTIEDLCCSADERCCGADSADNICIPAGEGSCCGVDECTVEAGACYVSCDAGFCRQHICNEGAVCCPGSAGGVSCVPGDCCSDADCAAGEVCHAGYCSAAVECLVDTDCIAADTCIIATCQDGACVFAPLCPGDCATCADGVCATDGTMCGLCGACNAGVCAPVVCPEGYTCFDATGECLGIA